MSSRKVQMWAAIGLLLLGPALWLRTREPAQERSAASTPGGAELALRPSSANTQPAAPSATSAGAGTPRQGARAPLTPERQALRERVVSTLREREHKRAAAAPGPASTAAADGEQVGTMVDKTGELTAEEMRILNHELMPMVSQCLDQAHERDPKMKGMLAVEVSFASAEDLGSIIDTVEPAPSNDLGETELLECVRQSAFSLEFPCPKSDRRGERMLTVPFGIDPKEWRPRAAPEQQPTAPAR